MILASLSSSLLQVQDDGLMEEKMDKTGKQTERQKESLNVSSVF